MSFPCKSERLVIALLRLVATGEYREGQRFLTRREIQCQWGVADKVALAALACLRDEGVLIKKNVKTVLLDRGAALTAQRALRSRTGTAPLSAVQSPVTTRDKPGNLLYRRLAAALLSDIAGRAWTANKYFLSRQAVEHRWGVCRRTAESARRILIEAEVLSRGRGGKLMPTADAADRAALLLARWRYEKLEPTANWKTRRNRLLNLATADTHSSRLAVIHDSPSFDLSKIHHLAAILPTESINTSSLSQNHLAGFLQIAQSHNCSTSFHHFDGSIECATRLIDQLSGRLDNTGKAVDGVALMTQRYLANTAFLLKRLQTGGLSTVCALNNYSGLTDVAIDCNETYSGFVAARKLLEAGHRHILVLDKGGHNEPFQKRRRNGIHACIQEMDLSSEVHLEMRRSPKRGRAHRILSCLERPDKDRPTAILFIDINALTYIDRQLWEAGIRFPGTASAITCGPRQRQSIWFGAIDIVDRDRYRMGKEAAHQLIRLLGGSPAPRSIQLDSAYIQHGTIRPH